VPLGLGDAATDAVIVHSGKAVPSAQSSDILTVGKVPNIFSRQYWTELKRSKLQFTVFVSDVMRHV
jgi:hypothetical protein